MKTTKIYEPLKENISSVASELKKGEIAAIPTETVYGLAANALDENAVAKIFKAKGRPADNPLISHISELQMLDLIAKNVPQSAYKLANAFWPGPLTLVLKRGSFVCDAVCAGLDTVAVRMPSHEIARQIISEAKVPLAAPSANKSGKPSPTTAQEVLSDMQGEFEYIIDGGKCEFGVESTVLSLADENEKPLLLRPGSVTKQQIEKVLGCEIEVSNAVTNVLENDSKAHSPGMKYKHYSPKAKMFLIKASSEKYIEYVNDNHKKNSDITALCFDGEEKHLNCEAITYGQSDNVEEQAFKLFSSLRKLDEIGAKIAFAHCPSEDGVGLAVYNRILRAAAFRVVEL